VLLTRAAELADASAGLTAPHPNAGVVLADAAGRVAGEASLWAQGTEAPEVAAARAAGAAARGGTAYLNLETGDCHGEGAGVRALLVAGVRRVVVGLRHPLPASRGAAVAVLRAGGAAVDVLGEARCGAPPAEAEAALDAVLAVNEHLLARAALGRPLGLLKYAMTLDGKIATAAGHSAWVSSPDSRARVFAARARADAVVVGGNTVRRDDPRLTTRAAGGHHPARLVMSRTLDLPADAALWDVAHAPTIVATQRGARRDFQAALRARGVEVLEFDFLTPDAVAAYCAARGFLRVLYECGGTLAAPALAGGAVHRVMAFVAPKIVGGARAPTPVGDLGFVEMTQALAVGGARWEQVGPDLLLEGWLPASGGPRALAAAAAEAARGRGGAAADGAGGAAPRVVEFYKAWDAHGCLSNFSPHAVALPDAPMTAAALEAFRPAPGAEGGEGGEGGNSGSGAAGLRRYPSAEHYYQSQKFAGVADPDAAALAVRIAGAASPEEAAALGRRAERESPRLVRPDWPAAKAAAMHAALRAKFAAHAAPRAALLATGAARLVEASPHDAFWGRGFDGAGRNELGRLLEAVRAELAAAGAGAEREGALNGAAS
jgi:diaminohydroxyphosphoribosylaminopyrimidine deaminase/5-amino-6-(5-phosphoribosylamino)uracil reductase